MNNYPTRLLWVDLEMTGLRPAKDKITEVAAIITDFELNELGTFEAHIRHPKKTLQELYAESTWHVAQPEYTEEMIQASIAGRPEKAVVADLVQFISKHITLGKKPEEYPYFRGSLEAKGEVYLAGSSIHADWAFIIAQWEDVARLLHYRMLDVSSFRLWMTGNKKLPKLEKSSSHRALDDIRASIAEMKHYSDNM